MNRDNRGFTFVEIMIVVMVLAILAAVALPKFSSSSDDARESALQNNLQTVRSQIEVYKAHHGGRTPDMNENGTADTANFVARLTGRTDDTGKVDAAGAFGPYVPVFPGNPFVHNKTDVKFGAGPARPDDTTAWYFDTSDGKFSPNDSLHTDSLELTDSTN